MKLKHASALLAGVGLAVCAGLALAQAPDWGPGAQGPGAAGPQRGPFGFLAVLGGEGVTTEVTKTNKGVDLTLKPDKPEALAGLQERVQQDVMNLQQALERVRQRPNQGAAGAQPGRNLMALLFSGDVEVSTRKTEKGVVISLTSDKPEVVQTLQEQAPQAVAQAREQAQRAEEARARWEKTREALALFANEEVKMEVKQTESGITVNITSANPDLAKQIQEKLPAYLEQQKEMAGNIGQWGARMGAMGAGMPGGPAMGRRGGPAGPGGARGPRGQRRAGPPPEAGQ